MIRGLDVRALPHFSILLRSLKFTLMDEKVDNILANFGHSGTVENCRSAEKGFEPGSASSICPQTDNAFTPFFFFFVCV